MSKFFFPEYPNQSFNHKKYVNELHVDIVQAFKQYTHDNDIDVKYEALSETWYVTHRDRLLVEKFGTRQEAILWVLNNC